LLPSCGADVLTWESAADDINVPISICGREGSHIVVAMDVRPVLGKNSASKVIDFYLPLTDHPGTFEAQIKTADPGEQRTEGQWHPFHATNIRAEANLEMPLTTVSKVKSELDRLVKLAADFLYRPAGKQPWQHGRNRIERHKLRADC
jgi:hypothetical protein